VSPEAHSFSRPSKQGHSKASPSNARGINKRGHMRPDHIVIAVGAFHDPNFPRPTLSAWEESKHGWVVFTHDLAHLLNGRPTNR